MSNPDLWLGKGEQKTGLLSSVEATAKALDVVDKAELLKQSGIIDKSERTSYKTYNVGDVIDGNKLDELSGDLVGNQPNKKFVLVQTPLINFSENREQLLKEEKGYEEEEADRLDSMKEDFNKTPPIPMEGDGRHRIIAAKELGNKTILMWQEVSSKSISEAYHAAKKDGSNPELVKAVEDLLGEKAEGKQAAPNTPKGIAARIRNKKQRGALSAIDFGISVTIYNGALEFMANQVEKGTKLGNAIANTIKWVDDKMKGEKWNKGAFGKYMNDTYKVTLGDGREVEVVRDDSKETAEVINGWYQPIEQKILDSKEESLPANKWAERLKSKEDEDLWTGVRAFLEEKGTERVSRQELLDFVKDNRIEIVTVVKGEGYVVRDTKADKDIKEFDDYEEAVDFVLEQRKKGNDYSVLEKDKKKSVKFEQYQLPGEKENYKEVLVTLPSRADVVKEYNFKLIDYNNFLKSLDIPTPEERQKADAMKSELDVLKSKLPKIVSYQQGFAYLRDEFNSSHFDEPNILVHLRMNTRTDADGNKVLFLEEVQSDWGQEGKKKGFIREGWHVRDYFDQVIGSYETEQEAKQAAKDVGGNAIKGRIGIAPTAPFIMDTNAWVKLGLKTALQEAVAQGADKIAWTTGEQQNDRYSLEKAADEIRYKKNSDGTYKVVAYKDGENVSEDKALKEDKLETTLGKDVAQRIIDGVGKDIEGEKSLTGENLKVGGKGMKGFYGSAQEGSKGIIGGVAEKLFGQKVEKVAIPEGKGILGKPTVEELTKAKELAAKAKDADAVKFLQEQIDRIKNGQEENYGLYNSNVSASKFFDEVRQPSVYTQSSISITPELKAQVEKGLPLFGTQLSPEQELKQAFNEWKAENNKLGISVDWKRLAESDRKLLKALYGYIQKKIAQGAYSFEEFVKEYGKKIVNFEEQKNNWKALYDRAATRKGVSEEKAVESAVKKAAGVKKETKDKVQKFIDKAFAIGSGTGFKEGFTKGATAGGKAGFVTGKEEGFKEGFTKGATQGGKAGFVAGKEVGLEQGTEKGFTKGATEGMRAGAIEGRTQAVDMLRNALENLSGELTPKQISAIVQRLGRLKTFSEAAKQRFIDYADKVIEDANYIAKEKKATEIKKAVNKMSKRPNVAANDQSLYKSFAALSISHLTPQDLDTYMEWGEKIKTKALQPGDRAELAAFIEQAKQRQNAITQERSEKMKEGRMRNLRAEFDEMKEAGTLPEGITTFDEYVESRKPKSKSDPIQDKIRAVQERLSEIPTGENKMIDRLRNVDLSLLSEENLTLIDNSLYNYIDTGELFGIGDPIAAAEYLGRVKAAIEQGLKTRRQVDRKDVEILGMSNLFSTLGETKDSAAKLRAILIQPWLSAATKTNSKYIAIETALMAKADKLKIKQPNWNRIDLFGFLNEGEDNPELFNVLRDQKLSDLETLRDRVAKNVAEKDNSATAKAQKYAYDALKGSIESLGLNESSTLESIREKLSENELAFYNEMRKYLDQYSPKAIENMGLYGNKDVGITKNYWPRTTNKITERPTGVDAFDLYGSEYVGKNMFGREKGRSRLLGKSGYYTPVGQENYFNGLKETMLIAEAADEYHGMQALYNSPDKGYGQLIKGQGASDFKQLMIDYIMDTKNVGRYRGDVADVGADILNAIQKGFTRSLINNPTQVPKQTTALAYPFVEAPKAFFKAVGLILQGMVDGKDSPVANAINGLFDTTTLGLRLYHPEMIDLKEKFTIDKPEILRNTQQQLKGFNKRWGGDLLPPTDKVISQIATLTGYIEQAERSGKKFNIFDEQEKGYDMVAAAAAEQMQSKTNNENAAIYFSRKQIKNRALYYLSNFQANSVRNLYISVRKIVSARTAQEREEGFQGVAAYLLATSLFVGAGMLTSYAVNVSAFYLYQQIMNELGDTEDDEEEKERILKYLDSRQLIGLKRKAAGEIISIATGPYGLLARGLVEFLSAKFEQAYNKATEEEEKPSDRIFFAPEVGGYAGVVADNIIAPFEVSENVNDPKAETMVETGLLTAKFLGQSAVNFYTQSLVNAKRLVEKEAKARKEEKNKLQGEANPKQKELAKSKKEWTKSIEQGDAGSARKAYEEVVKISGDTPYITAIELRDSFLEDKVKPSVIGSADEYIFRSYIFDDKNGNYMIGEKKLKELIPASEKQRYIDEYRREIAKIQKMLAVMNKAVKVKNAYGTDVDWAKPSGWVKQVQDKLQKK